MGNKIKNLTKILIRNNPGTNFATSIRAISALMVFAVHTRAFNPAPNIAIGEYLENLHILASMAPVAFFVASGYVLFFQYSKSRGLVRFCIRRYLRLTPLYLCVLVFLLDKQEISLIEILYRAFYLDVFNSQLFLSDPYGIFWTIAIEFWCSLLIPLLVFSFSKKFGYCILTITLIISLFGPYLLVFVGVNQQHAFKSVLVGLFPFAVGVFFAQSANNNMTKRICLMGMILSFLLSLIYIFFSSQTNQMFLSPWWIVTIFVSSFVGYSHNNLSKLKSNSALLYLGTICYGIYLTHIPISIFVTKFFDHNIFLISLIPVLMLSSITYLLIEYPFTRIFKK